MTVSNVHLLPTLVGRRSDAEGKRGKELKKFRSKSLALNPKTLKPVSTTTKPLTSLADPWRLVSCSYVLNVFDLACNYWAMTSQFTTLLTSSHLDIKVPLTPIPPSTDIPTILAASSRRTLFFGTSLSALRRITVDESVNLFIIFKIPVEAVEAEQLDVFLKETVLTLEVAITETTRQNDPVRREKFEGTIVHTTTISEDSERIKEKVEDHWLISWNLSVPISIPPI